MPIGLGSKALREHDGKLAEASDHTELVEHVFGTGMRRTDGD